MKWRIRKLTTALLELKNLKKYFAIEGQGLLHAVDDVSVKIPEGETLGLVGESGCGKSTVGLTLVRLLDPTSGEVLYRGKNIFSAHGKESKQIRKKMQIIFQDPYSSLNPKKVIKSILSEPYIIHGIRSRKVLDEKINRLLEMTGSARNILTKYPHELDGGKRQTIGIARALALDPDFIVCDEPVSALDVSIQAQILNLLMDLQQQLHLTYLFITHDLSVVKHISQRIAVMYLGKIVEIAQTDELFNNPLHPYTQALLSAIPSVNIDIKQERIILKGDVPSPINPKPICRFYERCWKATKDCEKIEPQLELKRPNHWVSCIKVPVAHTEKRSANVRNSDKILAN
jgi:oligopeptide/dipeptide ABC transporter ATP-binding protein